MIKTLIEQHFKMNRMTFPDKGRVELEKALIFVSGQSFAASFFLFALGPRLPLFWPGASLHLSIALFFVGAGCIVALTARKSVLVQKEDAVNDSLLALVFDDESIDRAVKKYIAIEIKRQGYVSYRQLLAYGEISHHRNRQRLHGGASIESQGAAAFLQALNKGKLG